jgi:cysteine desulfurase family protein (TIGR01976 family)
MATWDVDRIRSCFPALSREVDGQPAAFFDGPAGSQVPQRVIDAVVLYLRDTNANHGGCFATSRESDAMLATARSRFAAFLGAGDADEIVFGANMTTLTFAFSRALAKTWVAGDEVLVTRLDHDANVTPWVLAARDAGATVRHVEIRPEDCTLDLQAVASKLTSRTRLVAVGLASNAVGTINPVAEIVRAAHQVGALVFVDAVHYAPHGLIDVAELDCDFLVCSAYKFFGPHVGILWGKRKLLDELTPYKVRPASNACPDKWMTGTPNLEGIAGASAAVDYLARLGTDGKAVEGPELRAALSKAFTDIGAHERALCEELMSGLLGNAEIYVYGIIDRERFAQRVPTVSFVHEGHRPQVIAEFVARRGIFVWSGNHYAQPWSEALGLEPAGTVRVGLLHYNTSAEVSRLLNALEELP